MTPTYPSREKSGAPDPLPHEAVCFNCAHCLWTVALGIGVLCGHEGNRVDGHAFAIPSRRHGCALFDPKTTGQPQ